MTAVVSIVVDFVGLLQGFPKRDDELQYFNFGHDMMPATPHPKESAIAASFELAAVERCWRDPESLISS